MRLPRIFKREPDFIIGGKDDPYLLRWYGLCQVISILRFRVQLYAN